MKHGENSSDKGNSLNQGKQAYVRNSTAEFLIFTNQAGEPGIEVRVQDETVWLTQKLIGALFGVDVRTVSEHLSNLFATKELTEQSVLRKFRNTAEDGKDYLTNFYNLDAIIGVGFRVGSNRAIQFRQWARGVLGKFAIRGYVLDKERLKNGAFLSRDYFEDLLAEIREIRASERRFYQKITDIYATAMDYNKDADTTKTFFALVQNRLHFAIHGNTAAEVIMNRADAEKEHMGLKSWKNEPHGKILKPDVSVAKNYLSLEEIGQLDRIVEMYVIYAEDQAIRRIPMTMEDWASKLNAFLQFNQREILRDSGKVTHAIAKAFAESEFETYRVIQDRLYQSDFDRVVQNLPDPSEEQ